MAMNNGYRKGSDQSSASIASSRSSHSAAVDEAFRRVGHRLSQSVGGDEHSTPVVVANLGGTEQSAFSPRAQHEDDSIRNHTELGYDRTAKVAKTRYTDHGTHQKLVAGSILKNLTYHAEDTFSTLKQQAQLTPSKTSKKRISPSFSLSPHRQALEGLALEETNPKGLLQSVLDVDNNKTLKRQASSTSSTSTVPISHQSKRKCLTQPCEPVANDGLDNADGNLIVYENDRISVPRRQVHTLLQGRNQFRVISLLGQGTFAQVFKCQCIETGEIVALKIVKNKPAYTRQAAIEIDVFTAMSGVEKEHMVRLQCYFMYHQHLCLVFELLGLNLYEVLKRRQFRGLPLQFVRMIVSQALTGVKDLCLKNIVHCDLKPENILFCNDEDGDAVVNAGETKRTHILESEHETSDAFASTPTTDDTGRTSAEASSSVDSAQTIKLIDFGSACFEGQAAHTYIQSRFYRSPEVLIGLQYDSAIDMWSMGCVAAELFLGLPILPGVHEHDQLGRISEMIGQPPDRMLEQGSKSTRYFCKELSLPSDLKTNTDLPPRTPSPVTNSPPPPKVTWRLKTQQEYIQSLSSSEIRKKGGLAKLEKRPANRYFKRKKLVDIIMLHGHLHCKEEKETLGLFAHFLMGILDPDPLKRWTAYQASMHPFITSSTSHRHRSLPQASSVVANREVESLFWTPPWDAVICRRKLLDVQRTRDKQRALRRSLSGGNQPRTLPAGYGGRSLDTSPDSLRRVQLSVQRPSHLSSAMDRVNRQGAPQPLSRSYSDQLSSPSSSNGVVSYQLYPSIPQPLLPGSLGAVSESGTTMNSVAYMGYATSSSLSDNNFGVAVDERMVMSGMYSSSMQMPYHDVFLMQGAQSFSGIHGESVHHLPAEADFGYALQRPGVVPGMDLSSSGGMRPPVAGMAYPSHYTPAGAHQRSRSFTHSGGGYSQQQTRRSSAPYTPSDCMSSPGIHGQTQFMHMVSPTSIKEDSTDFVLGGSAAPSVTSSLLTQQLEGRSAGQHMQAYSYQEQWASSDRHFPPAYVGAPPGGVVYANNNGQPMGVDPSGGYCYMPYMTANGVAVSSDAVNVQGMPPAHVQGNSYCAYPEQHMPFWYGPPDFLPQAGYSPANVYQPTFENTEQNGSMQRPHCPPPHYYNQGMSM